MSVSFFVLRQNMRLTDILKPINIKVPLAATNKADVIRELVDLLAVNNEIVDGSKVLEAVLDREATRTTGIGYGLAIPHGKSAGATQLTMAIGRCEQPVEFQAIDGKPVSMIWMLVSPPDKAGLHIATLARISRLMMVDRFRLDLLRAADSQGVFDTIANQEKESA